MHLTILFLVNFKALHGAFESDSVPYYGVLFSQLILITSCRAGELCCCFKLLLVIWWGRMGVAEWLAVWKSILKFWATDSIKCSHWPEKVIFSGQWSYWPEKNHFFWSVAPLYRVSGSTLSAQWLDYFCHLQNKVALSVLTSGRVDFMGDKIIVWTASKYPPKIRKNYISAEREKKSIKPWKNNVFCAADRVFSLFLCLCRGSILLYLVLRHCSRLF